MSNYQCPIGIHCPDYPFANLSSEGIDLSWLPPRGQYWTAVGYCCDGAQKTAWSSESQAGANESLDTVLATACATCDDTDKLKFCADASCPDGTLLTTKCVPTSQADADALAAAAAAAMLPYCDPPSTLYEANCACPDGVTDRHTTYSNISQAVADADCAVIPKTCDSNFESPPVLSTLPAFSCLAQSFAQVITLSGAIGTFTWQVYSGALPPGLTLTQTSNITALLSGIPTTAGTYTFTIRVILGANLYVQKDYTMVVFGFITASDLPDGTVGTSYVFQIEADGGSGNYFFEVVAGVLPDGLVLSDTGFITGTPTTEDLRVFTVQVQDLANPTYICSLQFQIDVSKVIYAYYKCDETVGLVLAEEVGGRNMTVSALLDPVPGIINGGLHMTAIGNYADTISSAFFNFFGHDFSVRFWFKLDAPMSYPNFGLFLGFNNWAVGYNISAPLQGIMFRVTLDSGAMQKVVGGIVSPGVWHRVCAWWHPGVEMGIKVDNNASITAVPTDIMKDNGDFTLFIAASSLGHTIDEIAVWRDHILTEDEMTFDWNSGAGQTYPNVP